MKMHSSNIIASVLLFLAAVARPAWANRTFEPNTPEQKGVLLELFDAIFTPTIRPTIDVSTHAIRGQIENYFGYVSRTDVDYVLATLGHVPDADLDELEEILNNNESHTPKQYKRYCKIPLALWRRLLNSRTVNEWVSTIENGTGRALPLTKAFLAERE